MTEKEARTNKAGADLDKRNRNWSKVDRNTNNIDEMPEIIANSNGTAFKFPSGLLIFYSNEFNLTYNAGNLLQASRDTPVAFRDTDCFIKPQINIPAASKRVDLYQDVVMASSASYTIRLISGSASNFTAGDTVKARVFGAGRWK